MTDNITMLEHSGFFARLSNYAYKDLAFMRVNCDKYQVEYHGHAGADAYTLEDAENIIIACRGTEVKQLSDVKADVSIGKTKTPHGKLHIGFNHYVDKIWHLILPKVRNTEKQVWVTGHSLGAAMATIITYRLATDDALPTPAGLFTYGSPRVGDRTFINYFNTLPVPHHRWVNDGDIVTKIPLAPWFYHCGVMHHIDAQGEITVNYERTWHWKRMVKLINPKSIINLIMDDAKDHSSDLYLKYLGNAVSR